MDLSLPERYILGGIVASFYKAGSADGSVYAEDGNGYGN